MAKQEHQHVDAALKIADSGFDFTEIAVLNVIRAYCMAYSNTTHPHWENAIDVAIGTFGEHRGPALAVAILDVLRRLRVARKTRFCFHNPYCPICSDKVSDCERLLMQTIKYVKAGDHAGARFESMMLCEGHDAEPTLDAMQKLVQLTKADA